MEVVKRALKNVWFMRMDNAFSVDMVTFSTQTTTVWRLISLTSRTVVDNRVYLHLSNVSFVKMEKKIRLRLLDVRQERIIAFSIPKMETVFYANLDLKYPQDSVWQTQKILIVTSMMVIIIIALNVKGLTILVSTTINVRKCRKQRRFKKIRNV